MEYILLLGGLGEAVGTRIKMGLQTAYDKLFENPWLLALFAGGLILLGLWALRPSR
jgi:hypothetical protein